MPRIDPEYAHVATLAAESEQLTQDLELLGSRVEVAVNRALKKLARWLRTHAMREIGRELKITQKALKKRFVIKHNSKGKDPYINIWFGLLNVAAHEVGTARQNAAGARVAGRQFDGAFVKKIYGSEEKVYIRTRRNRREGHATISQRPWRTDSGSHYGGHRFLDYGGANDTSNRGRFPVQVVGIEIEEVARDILERYELRINARYQQLLQQEVNYALYVESRS